MGKVAVEFVVMPKGVEIDMTKLRARVESALAEIAKPQRMEEKPIAFGLRALHVHLIVNDEGGIVDRIEKALRNIDDVESAEAVSVTLI
ncbi:MAG: elongation factor 1-beta [Thermoplasmata archaeon]|nr:MAG: elongation factor 1-beta [Thermoplasmata archaeon]